MSLDDHVAPGVTTLEHVVDIDADPATVYDLWVTAEGVCAWWGVDATVEARPGGEFRVDIDGEHVMVGRFTALERPRHVAFTFGWEGGEPPPESTRVDVHIEAAGGGTRLTLRHAGLPLAALESHARGWQHFLGEQLTAERTTASAAGAAQP